MPALVVEFLARRTVLFTWGTPHAGPLWCIQPGGGAPAVPSKGASEALMTNVGSRISGGRGYGSWWGEKGDRHSSKPSTTSLRRTVKIERRGWVRWGACPTLCSRSTEPAPWDPSGPDRGTTGLAALFPARATAKNAGTRGVGPSTGRGEASAGTVVSHGILRYNAKLITGYWRNCPALPEPCTPSRHSPRGGSPLRLPRG